MVIHDPPFQNPGTTIENITSSRPITSSVEAFMGQLGNATFVNVIIDNNKDTIMVNLKRDNVRAFYFGRTPPLMDIPDPTHPLFGKLAPLVGHSYPNDPLYIPRGGRQPVIQ